MKRINTLFIEAKSMYKTNPKLSEKYVITARKIAMAANIRFSEINNQQICKKCNALFIPGENYRVRIQQNREPHVVTTCLSCGYQKRNILRKKRKELKNEH